MKRFFLIDLENVGRTFMQGIDELTISDTLVICHNLTINNSLKEDVKKKLLTTKATVKWLQIANVSKNAMDFELMIELGYQMQKFGSGAKYFIVSNDKGFDVAADFSKCHQELGNVEVRRITSLVENFAEEERIIDLEEELTRLLPEYSKKVIKIVRQDIDQSKTVTQLNNFMQKHILKDYMNILPRVRHLVECKASDTITHTRKKSGQRIAHGNRLCFQY